jgi:hypothetical protein
MLIQPDMTNRKLKNGASPLISQICLPVTETDSSSLACAFESQTKQNACINGSGLKY